MKVKCHCQYGDYEISRRKHPDKNLFRLRIKALLINEEFKNYCAQPDISDADRAQPCVDAVTEAVIIDPCQQIMERDVLAAWDNFSAWAEQHKDDHCLIALLFYGNIFDRQIGFTWTRFHTAVDNVYVFSRPFPFHELPPGTQAPHYSRTISFDPTLRRKYLKPMFQKFLSSIKKAEIAHHALSGYYELQPKVKLDEASRFVQAAKRAAELRAEHPKTWLALMTKLYEAYPGTAESRRKTIYKDIKKGKNISWWALRGFFPRTSNPPTK